MGFLEIFLALLWLLCISLIIHSHLWHKQIKVEKAQGSAQAIVEEEA
jgi:hypothetical protein